MSAHHPTPASALTLPQKLFAHTQEHPQRLAQRVKRKGVWHCYTWSDVFERTRSMALGAAAQGLRRGETVIVIGENEKRAAFRMAHAALAKSGTVTLELALSGIPMVTAYRVGAIEAFILRRAIRVSSVILANLVIGRDVIPEYLQEDCTPEKLSAALAELLTDSPLRRQQVEAFAQLDQIMSTGNKSPSALAADIVLATMRKGRR